MNSERRRRLDDFEPADHYDDVLNLGQLNPETVAKRAGCSLLAVEVATHGPLRQETQARMRAVVAAHDAELRRRYSGEAPA